MHTHTQACTHLYVLLHLGPHQLAQVYGQVHPLYSLPKMDTKLGVQPQKVAFHTPREGHREGHRGDEGVPTMWGVSHCDT